ncbi:MAG TPA: class I SAM-dependent methyltransferase [Kofleriaceae bacterium]|nr:class I SAM-dependent methyltransferase [Kofleriaceae bacterium]
MTAGGEHRVASHLGVDAAAYDVAIRRFVPHYEAMIGVVLGLLDEQLPAEPLVVDLGAGTGALAAAILDAIPRARVELVDIDPAMLEVARSRVARHGDRAVLRRASFFDPLPACDAIVASLSLHHVPERDRKQALYRHAHAALRPGGILLSADATVHEAGPEHDRVFREWAAWMAAHGIAEPEARAHFAQWAGEDRYYPIAVELALLAGAGFAHPECFWKQGPSTVFGGFR